MSRALLLILFTFISISSNGQCPFNPSITGNLILCPNGTETLSTQSYDTYQWYKRSFGGTAAPIPGATADTLVVDYFNDAGYYFAVEATDEGCTEMSPEVLVDGWVFLLPTVMTTGEFTIGPNGETIVCEEDTAYFELMQPYDTNITWYQNGVAIPGATGNIFQITDSGSFTVEGAPTVCPNFIQPLGVTLDVQIINCNVGIDENGRMAATLYPNPVENNLTISTLMPVSVNIYTSEGRLAMTAFAEGRQSIDISTLMPGNYIIEFISERGERQQSRLVISR